MAAATRSRWRLLGASTALAAGAVLAGVGLLATSGYLISRAAQRPDILALGVAIAAVRSLAIARAALRYGERLRLPRPRLPDAGRPAPALLRPPGPARAGRPARRRARATCSAASSPTSIACRTCTCGRSLRWRWRSSRGAPVCSSPPSWRRRPAPSSPRACSPPASSCPRVTRAAARAAGRRQAADRAALTTTIVEAAGGATEIAMAGRERDWIRAGRPPGRPPGAHPAPRRARRRARRAASSPR